MESEATAAKLLALEQGHAAIIRRLDDLNTTAWRMVAAISLPLLGLFAWGFIQIWPVNGGRMVSPQADAQAVQERAVIASRQYTAQDAAQDRARQEAVNTAMLQALQRLEQRRARH